MHSSTSTSSRGDSDHSARLGPRLKASRRAAGQSLAQVATATGISKSFLALVESGQSDITFSRLLRLTEHYGVKVGELLSDDQRDYAIIRRGEGREVSSGEDGMSVEMLLPGNARNLRSMIVTLTPGGRMSEPAQHEGREFIHVLQGTALLDLEGVGEIALRAGDSAFYDASRAHAYRNDSKYPVRILSVVSDEGGAGHSVGAH